MMHFRKRTTSAPESSLYQVQLPGGDVNDLATTIGSVLHCDNRARDRCWWIFPKDVSMARADFTYPSSVSIRGYNPTYEGNKWQIKRAAETIMKAKPILYVSSGVVFSQASKELLELAEMTQIPVDMTLMGLRRVSRRASPIDGHVGHARDLLRQRWRSIIRIW